MKEVIIMPIETLKQNRELIIDKSLKTDLCYFLVESSIQLPDRLLIDDCFEIFPIKTIDPSCMTHELIQPLKIAIEELLQTPFPKKFYYIILAKMVAISELENLRVITFHPNDIIQDLLNILSLSYKSYFSLNEIFIPPFVSNELGKKIIKNKFLSIELNPDSAELSNNIKLICALRAEQFNLIQKGFLSYNMALYSSEFNLSIAFSLLISSIEPFAAKYSEVKSTWDELVEEGLYKNLQKLVDHLPIEENLKVNFLSKIGADIMKYLYRVKGKFIDFVVKLIPMEYRIPNDPHDRALRSVFSELYDLRSGFLHSGKLIPASNRRYNIMYNPVDGKKGKLKTYDEGKKIDLREIPRFDWFLHCITMVIWNFINYLYVVKDENTDLEKYTDLDRRPRGILEGTVKKRTIAGTLIDIRERMYQREDNYINLQKKIIALKKNEAESNYDICKELLSEFIDELRTGKEPRDTIRLSQCYTKLGIILSKQGKYAEAIEMINNSFKINQKEANNDYLAADYYNFACFYCLKEDFKVSIENLQKAVKIYPDYKKMAMSDPDFDKIRDSKEFLRIINE